MEEKKSFKEFCVETKRAREKEQFKIRNSWGVYDAYKAIRKHGWYNIGRPLKEKEFYGIIRQINDLLAEELANGNTIVFPEGMGILELRKSKRGVSIVDGKLKITYPVDWSKTLRLWYEDEEARKKKLLLRREHEYIYRVKYNKFRATYNNKSLYEFTLNRGIKLALKDNIEQGKVDCLR